MAKKKRRRAKAAATAESPLADAPQATPAIAKKKRKRAKAPEPGLLRFFRKQGRTIGIMGGLALVLAAIWFIADPFGGGLTAIDPVTGEEVRAGIIAGQDGASGRRGDPAPNFLLPDYDGFAVRLDEVQGKVVFVNFWASWCGPCEREMPSIIRIAEEFPDDVVVLAVNRGESKSTATGWTRRADRPFREDLENFHWLLDRDESVWRKYRAGSGMPQSVFLTTSGIINREVRQGMEYSTMLQSVEQALAASAPPVLPDDSSSTAPAP